MTAAELTVSRIIAAGQEQLFDAWVKPDRLIRWWGPDGVTCPGAEIDARPGGLYRIGNRFADGSTLWIAGAFVDVERPDLLRFTWRIEGRASPSELVTVRFLPRGDRSTEVMVTHERIESEEDRQSHRAGWTGCLDALAACAET